MSSKPKLLTQVRNKVRAKGYSYSTEKTYVQWIRQFVHFHDLKHPASLSQVHVAEFLTYLVNQRYVAGSTQNQALCALLFLYRQVLGQPKFRVEELDWSKKPKRIPVDMSSSNTLYLLCGQKVPKNRRAGEKG